MRQLPKDEAAPFIACVFAAERATVRLAKHYGEIAEAREVSLKNRIPLAEAAGIVRRSRG